MNSCPVKPPGGIRKGATGFLGKFCFPVKPEGAGGRNNSHRHTVMWEE